MPGVKHAANHPLAGHRERHSLRANKQPRNQAARRRGFLRSHISSFSTTCCLARPADGLYSSSETPPHAAMVPRGGREQRQQIHEVAILGEGVVLQTNVCVVAKTDEMTVNFANPVTAASIVKSAPIEIHLRLMVTCHM